MSVAFDFDHRSPSQYQRCVCGNWKSARAWMCKECYERHKGTFRLPRDMASYVACGCGRERPVTEKLCAVCRGLRPETCDQGERVGCGLDWSHAHCCNCGAPCAVNWPLCGECESEPFLLHRHSGEALSRQSHGDLNRVRPTAGRRRIALNP